MFKAAGTPSFLSLQNLRPYLPLLTEILMESALEKDGRLIPHEDVIKKLNEDTVSASVGLGLGGGRLSPGKFSQCAVLSLQVRREKLALGIEWVHDLILRTKFTSDRVKVVTTKVENGIAEVKRSGRSVLMSAVKALTFGRRNNRFWDNVVSQQKFLRETVLAKLNGSDEDKAEVISNLKAVRDILAAKYAVFVATDFEKIPSNALQLLERGDPVKK